MGGSLRTSARFLRGFFGLANAQAEQGGTLDGALRLRLLGGASGMEVDLSKIPHGFVPKLLKAVGQSVSELLVPD